MIWSITFIPVIYYVLVLNTKCLPKERFVFKINWQILRSRKSNRSNSTIFTWRENVFVIDGRKSLIRTNLYSFFPHFFFVFKIRRHRGSYRKDRSIILERIKSYCKDKRANTKLWNTSSSNTVPFGDLIIPTWLKDHAIVAEDAYIAYIRPW